MNRVYDVRHLLPAVITPTLVIHTENNRLVPAAHGEYIAEWIPERGSSSSQVQTISYLKNHGTEVVDEVEEFLTGRRTTFTDRIHAAMLITDIKDSTTIAETIGDDSWNAKMIVPHNDLMRSLIHTHHGEECKHGGTDFWSCSPTPRRRCNALWPLLKLLDRSDWSCVPVFTWARSPAWTSAISPGLPCT